MTSKVVVPVYPFRIPSLFLFVALTLFAWYYSHTAVAAVCCEIPQ